MDWDMYFVELGGSPATVLVDLQADAPERMAGRPFLVRATVILRDRTAHGLASRDEDEVLNDVENALEKAAQDVRALYVARVTREGRRIFCYYAPDGESCGTALAAAASEAGTYRLTIDSERDQDWAFYREFLYPPRVQWQEIMNHRIIDTLRAHGDLLATPRRVDHWAYFPTADERAPFVSACVDAGFRVAEEIARDGRFAVQLFHHLIPEEDRLNDVTRTLIDLAESYGGEYHGWETEVVTGAPA